MTRPTLIVPMAGRHTGPGMPHLFRMAPDDGLLLFVKSITGLDLEKFGRIVFTLLADDARRYGVAEIAAMQLRRLGLDSRAEILELDTPTASQPATLAETCRRLGIAGPVTFKDADSWFRADIPADENSVCLYRLDALTSVNPQGKSYATIDDMNHITNIIERRIVGPWFCVGGYTFADAALFLDAYDRLAHKAPLYMSHIIYSLLLQGQPFTPVAAEGYLDWGTPHDADTNQ